MAVYDLRKEALVARSEDDSVDEMLSVAIVKVWLALLIVAQFTYSPASLCAHGMIQGGKKVVCGHQSGVLDIYSWGYWNDCSDRFPGHPGSVDTLVKVRSTMVRWKPLGCVSFSWCRSPVCPAHGTPHRRWMRTRSSRVPRTV